MEDLPSKVDVIVVGTGLTESIVSAAVSRNGHTVLHLDPRDYYGGKWTTVNWEGLQSETFAETRESPFSSGGQEKEDEVKTSVNQMESEFLWNNPIRNVEQVWYVEDEDKKTEISKQSRKFNIDVFPKVLLAREELIQLLIESNVSRYLEFKCITKLFTSLPPPQQNVIEPIPLSRSDIFTTKSLGLVEKRKLTKFIEAVLSTESAHPSLSSEPNEESTTATVESPPAPSPVKTFDELVQSTKINEKIQHLIKSAVRTVEDGFEDSVTFNTEFLDRCRLFLQSIGRYGNQTPYLWTLYGIGEVCQAFCRLSAIYGGIFILKRSIQKVSLIKVESEKPEESSMEQLLQVKTNDLEIKSKYLVLGAEVKHGQISKIEKSKTVIRGILLTTDGSLKRDTSSEKGEGNQMYVYKIGNSEVIELDHSSLAVPKPFRLIHVTCPLPADNKTSQISPRSIVEAILEPFLNFNPYPTPKKETEDPSNENEKSENVNSTSANQSDSSSSEIPLSPSGDTKPKEESTATINKTNGKPSVLYGSYFLIDFHENKNKIEEEHVDISSHILHCATGSTEITQEINKAREIFKTMYPQETFLPKTTDEASEQDVEDEEDHDDEEPAEESTVSEDIHTDQNQVEENKEQVEPISSSLPSST